MFKKAKRKIVISILSILCAVLVGTLGMIYLTSFLTVTSNNFEVLEKHTALANENDEFERKEDIDDKNFESPKKPLEERPGRAERSLKVGTFYAVKFFSSGSAEVIENSPDGIYTDAELIEIAQKVVNNDKGRTGELLYIVNNLDGEAIVTFMDNTAFTDSFSMLFIYTLIFGVIAIIVITFISVGIAGRIVSPMEENYKKQKQFTADAGHELKTPIAAVSANAELLKREIGDNRWLENIVFENERMKALVSELLELARNENKTADKKPTDLSRLVTGTVLPLEATAFEKGITIENYVEDGIIENIDEKSVSQLVTILVDNAISHTKATKNEKSNVEVKLSSYKGTAVLTVANPGKEIPEDEKEKIFERFYRSDASHEFTGHYGLGLAIAKSIADLNGAKITVECENSKVCFKVIFK